MPDDVPRSADDVRRRVASLGRDPLPDVPDVPPRTQPWVAASGELDAARLGRLVDEAFAANRHVHYVRNHAPVRSRVRLRHALDGTGVPPLLRLSRATAAEGTPAGAVFRPRAAPGQNAVELQLSAGAGAPVELAVLDGAGLADGGWWALDDGGWRPAATARGTATESPFELREPVAVLPAALDDGLWGLPAAVLGRPVVDADREPVVVTGESRAEARADEGEGESVLAVRRRPDGRWTTVHEVGLRWVRVQGARVRGVEVEACAHPVPRRGAFACSDDRLTDIWATSAHTLRQCLHDLPVDGIKRDRLPWMGDQAVAVAANAHALGDQEAVESGLRALGRPRDGYVNGIADYSMWWVITTARLTRFFDAREHLRREAAHLHGFVERLAADTDADGVFRPRSDVEGFHLPVFIDWGAAVDPERDSTALQLLWHWALSSAVEVLGSVGHPGAARWRGLAGRLAAALRRRGWDAGAGRWRDHLDGAESASPHPTVLAVLSGLDPGGPGVRRALREAPGSGTPFMATFALEALGAAGDGAWAVQRVRELWGAVLDAGATAFWEDFAAPPGSPPGTDLAMYGRPFGRSLCHGWAAGPASLLPQLVCGLRPTAPGWSRFAVAPQLDGLAWAAAVVPTARGDLSVVAERGRTRVVIPPGCALETPGGATPGPLAVEW